jgi:hypothetical protein
MQNNNLLKEKKDKIYSKKSNIWSIYICRIFFILFYHHSITIFYLVCNRLISKHTILYVFDKTVSY